MGNLVGTFIKRLECTQCHKIIHAKGWRLLDAKGGRHDDKCPQCGGTTVTFISHYMLKAQTTLPRR